MQNTYLAKRARLENYFNEVSSDAWDKLTSNEPVSFVRQLVREGREKMQAAIIEKLPMGSFSIIAACIFSRPSLTNWRTKETGSFDVSLSQASLDTSLK